MKAGKCFLLVAALCASGVYAQDSLNVRKLGQLSLWAYGFSVIVQDSFAFVAAEVNGLRIVDVTDPGRPVETGFFDTPGEAFGIALNGNYAYLADGSSGLRVIDVSNPAAPAEVGFCDTPSYALGVAVCGSYAYVADDYSGLWVVDVSNPAAPTPVGSYDTPGEAYGIAVRGDYAYVADYASGLRIVSISDPAAPFEVGFYNTRYCASGVAVSGDQILLTDGGSLRILDVSNPANPSEIGCCDTPGDAWSVAVSGSYAYVADWYGGLQVVDIRVPGAPSLVGFYYCLGVEAFGVAVADSIAYLSEGGYLEIYDVSRAIGWNGPLNAPQNLVVRYVPQGTRFQLNWNPVTTDTLGIPIDVARYVVYRTSVAGTVGDSLGVPLPPDTTFFVDSVSFGQADKFFYQVRAVGGVGP